MSGDQQFKINLKVKKRFCKHFARLKPAGRRSRFLKNERFFTFFKKSAKQRPQLQSMQPAGRRRRRDIYSRNNSTLTRGKGRHLP
ncbi:MAG: hypothetical protein IJM24_04055, partial [Clostridia bacterium]|nr:hypothetical protein [Clostridia bacterium]